jgi:dephospho-CoA kinase
VKKPGKMFVIGITGPSGAGKSTVANLLASEGFKVLDVDRLARNLYLPGRAAYATVKRLFGPGILTGRGRIDRRRLGRLVFGDKALLRRLDSAMKPLIFKEIKSRLAKLKGNRHSRVALDMAILLHAGAESLVDQVILVEAPLKTRLARLKARGLDRERAKAQAKALKFGTKLRRRASLILQNGNRVPDAKIKLQSFLRQAGP